MPFSTHPSVANVVNFRRPLSAQSHASTVDSGYTTTIASNEGVGAMEGGGGSQFVHPMLASGGPDVGQGFLDEDRRQREERDEEGEELRKKAFPTEAEAAYDEYRGKRGLNMLRERTAFELERLEKEEHDLRKLLSKIDPSSQPPQFIEDFETRQKYLEGQKQTLKERLGLSEMVPLIRSGVSLNDITSPKDGETKYAENLRLEEAKKNAPPCSPDRRYPTSPTPLRADPVTAAATELALAQSPRTVVNADGTTTSSHLTDAGKVALLNVVRPLSAQGTREDIRTPALSRRPMSAAAMRCQPHTEAPSTGSRQCFVRPSTAKMFIRDRIRSRLPENIDPDDGMRVPLGTMAVYGAHMNLRQSMGRSSVALQQRRSTSMGQRQSLRPRSAMLSSEVAESSSSPTGFGLPEEEEGHTKKLPIGGSKNNYKYSLEMQQKQLKALSTRQAQYKKLLHHQLDHQALVKNTMQQLVRLCADGSQDAMPATTADNAAPGTTTNTAQASQPTANARPKTAPIRDRFAQIAKGRHWYGCPK